MRGRLPACLLVLAAVAATGAEDVPPIQRVRVPPEQLKPLLEKAGQGTLVRLPRAEFEDRVDRAARSAEVAANPPRLSEARYRARLTDGALEGSAEWKVVNPTGRPALLPLKPLQLALWHARWPDNSDAVLAETGLLVEHAGERPLALDWSARGVPRPGETWFVLSVPLCPVASLELELPADLTPAVADKDLLLTELPAGEGRKGWRILFGGRNDLAVGVRRAAAPGLPPPLVVARTAATQELGPEQADCSFEVDVRAYRQPVSTLALDCDPGLRITEVSAPGLDGWEARPPAREREPARLQVRFREPFRAGTLKVRALTPPPAGDHPWVSPSVRVADAIPAGETLTLRVHPDWDPEDFRPGGFRLTGSKAGDDRWRVLTLQSDLAATPDSAGPPRPSARLRRPGTAVAVRQALVWSVEADGSQLEAVSRYEVRRGQLFQLMLRLPRGWQADDVRLGPAEGAPADKAPPGLRGWSVREARGDRPAELVVDLDRGLTPDTPVSLTARLSAGRPGRSAEFPDLFPAAPAVREGRLAIRLGPALRGEPATALPGTADVPGPLRAPDFVFLLRGEPVVGSLRLRPRSAQFQARSTVLVDAAGAAVRVTQRMELRPEAGSPTELILYTADATLARRRWRVLGSDNGLLSVREVSATAVADAARTVAGRLHPPLPGTPLAGSAVAPFLPSTAAPVAGSWWHLRLARPLREPLTLETTAELSGPPTPPEAAGLWAAGLSASLPTGAFVPGLAAEALTPGPPTEGGTLRVPILSLAPAADADDEAEVTVQLPAAGADLEVEGLRETVSGPGRRSFAADAGPPRLALTWGVNAGPARAEWAELQAAALPGRVLVRYRCRVAGGAGTDFPVHLPDGAVPLSASAGGRAVTTGLAGGVWRLPLAAGEAARTLEVTYALPQPSGLTHSVWLASAPGLPVATPSPRRSWWLPGDFRPASSGWSCRTEPPLALGALFSLPSSWPSRPPAGDALAAWRSAEAKVGPPRPGESLGDHLARVATEAGVPVVVDAAALAEAGMGPDAPAAAVSSAAVAHGVVLLTIGRPVPPTPEALAEALWAGRDAAGRYLALPDWADGTGPEADRWPHAGGRVWEADPSTPASDTLPAVRESAAFGGGFALAAGLTAVAVWLFRRRLPGRWAFLSASLLALALARLWLPEAYAPATTPALAALAVAGVLATLTRRPAVVAPPTGSGVWAKAAVGCLAALALPALAVGPPATPVYLVPGPADAPDREGVLAPPELLDRLQTVARRGSPESLGAVVVAVKYEGKATEAAGTASFRATFEVRCLADEATVNLPLSGINLSAALLDGARANPTASKTGDRYTVDVAGRGAHTLTLEFTVPLGGSPDDREIRFSVPELAQCRLSLELPAGVSAQTPVCVGRQRVSGGRLEAELGPVRSASVRWRAAGGRPRPAEIRVQEEALLWDIQEGSSRLLTAWLFRVGPGSASELDLLLPPDLEPLEPSVTAGEPRGTAAPRPAAGPPPALKGWSLDPGPNGQRRLRLELQAPVTGLVQVTLEMVPRQPFTSSPVLTFPSPAGPAADEGVLAYRVAGLEAELAEWRGVLLASEEQFVKRFWQPARAEASPKPVTQAFQRPAGATPTLRLRLRRPKLALRATQEVNWTVAPGAAALRAACRWTGPAASAAGLFEWDVPAGLVVDDVRGPGLTAWTRAGNRLQLWPDQPTADLPVVLTGTLPLPPNAPGPDGGVAELPAPRPALPDGAAPAGVVRVRSPGMTVTAEGPPPAGATAQPASPGEVAFQADGEAPSRFRLRPSPADVRFRLLSSAEADGGGVEWSAVLEVRRARRERTTTFSVRITGPTAAGATPEGPPGVRFTRTDVADGADWAVVLPAGGSEAVRLTWTGHSPTEAGRARMPGLTVTIGGSAAPVERWLAAGAGLRPAVESVPLSAEEASAALVPWPGAADRVRRGGGAVWRAGDGLTLAVAGPVGGGGSVRAVFAESWAVPEGGEWRHTARFLLYRAANVPVWVTLPEGGRLLSAARGGAEVPVRQHGGRWWPDLPASAGPCELVLRWRYEPFAETFVRPRPELPALLVGGSRVAPEATLATVVVPVGRLAPGPVPADMTPAAAWLHRAAAEATVLSLSRGTDPAGAAGRFARDLRDATQRLVGATLVRPVAGTGPDGKPWAEWLRALTDRPAVPASSPMPEDGGWPAGKVVCRASAGGATPPAVELSVDEGPALLRLLLTAAAGALAVSLWFAAGRSDARSERLLFLGALTGAFLPAPAGWVAIGVLAAGLLGLAGRAVVARLPRRQRSTPLG